MSNNPGFDYDAFRDTIGTVDEEGKRKWIYPKKPKGKFHNRRIVVSIILLTLLFTGPFLRWNDEPMFLFNFLERKNSFTTSKVRFSVFDTPHTTKYC